MKPIYWADGEGRWFARQSYPKEGWRQRAEWRKPQQRGKTGDPVSQKTFLPHSDQSGCEVDILRSLSYGCMWMTQKDLTAVLNTA